MWLTDVDDAFSVGILHLVATKKGGSNPTNSASGAVFVAGV